MKATCLAIALIAAAGCGKATPELAKHVDLLRSLPPEATDNRSPLERATEPLVDAKAKVERADLEALTFDPTYWKGQEFGGRPIKVEPAKPFCIVDHKSVAVAVRLTVANPSPQDVEKAARGVWLHYKDQVAFKRGHGSHKLLSVTVNVYRPTPRPDGKPDLIASNAPTETMPRVPMLKWND